MIHFEVNRTLIGGTSRFGQAVSGDSAFVRNLHRLLNEEIFSGPMVPVAGRADIVEEKDTSATIVTITLRLLPFGAARKEVRKSKKKFDPTTAVPPWAERA